MQSISNVTQLLNGWGTGYVFAQESRAEQEVQQGQNYYLGVPHKLQQLGLLTNIVYEINNIVPRNLLTFPIKLVCNIGPLLIGLPVFGLAAALKHGQYEEAVELGNLGLGKLPRPVSYVSIPKGGMKTKAVLNFIAKHGGKVLRVAMVAAGVALIALGNPFTGGALLAALGYQAIDELGLVPRKVSLFMETYMPTISTIGLLFGGTIVSRAICGLVLSTQIFSSFNRYIHYGVDAVARKIIEKLPGQKMKRASLKEFDAPVIEKKINDLCRNK